MGWIKAIALAFVAVIVGLGIIVGVEKSGLGRVSEIRVEGATPATEQRLRLLLLDSVGKPVWKLSLNRKLLQLKQDPWVNEASINFVWPARLLIKVFERKPFALFESSPGHFDFLDQDNHMLGTANPLEASHLPVISSGRVAMTEAHRGKAVALLLDLPADGPLSRADVSDVRFDETQGYVLTVLNPRSLPVSVELGSDNLQVHADRARKVLMYLRQNHIESARVDADYAKKVLVKVKRGR